MDCFIVGPADVFFGQMQVTNNVHLHHSGGHLNLPKLKCHFFILSFIYFKNCMNSMKSFRVIGFWISWHSHNISWKRKCHSWHIFLNEGHKFLLQWICVKTKRCEWKRATHPAGKWLLKLCFSIPSVPLATLWEDFEVRYRKQHENCHYADACLLEDALDSAWT